MVDFQVVCCMCGDVGFQDKLFRCTRCLNRFQHSYCSNYYTESSSVPVEQCDWCQSEQRNSTRHGGGSSSLSRKSATGHDNDRVKPNDQAVERGKNPGTSGAPSPRTATRRYKLLKDVMC